MKLVGLLAFGIASIALAMPVEPPTCNTFMVPITLTNISTAVLGFPATLDQYVATSILNVITDRVQSTTLPPVTHLSGTYNILAQLCYPSGSVSSTLQILTHGIGFNLTYWDFYPSANKSDTQYSYVAAATAAGYPTLSYNRLGIFGSSKADPETEAQSLVEIAILKQLTILARAGQLPTQLQTPTKVVHVGHSFGSILTNGLVGQRPDLSDGIVLTGYSHTTEYNGYYAASTGFLIANEYNSTLFPPSYYGSAYFTWPNKWANQYSFFAYPEFTKAVLDQSEATKQPVALGELASIPLLGNNTALGFKGPVFYVLGEKDLIFCASNCTGLVGPGTQAYQAFTGASSVENLIIPKLGHALNVHLGASEKVYAPIMQWMKSHNL